MYESSVDRMCQLVLVSWMTPTRRWVRNSVTARSSPRPAARSAGACSVIQVRAACSVKGWGTSVQAATCSSFIISVRGGTSSASRGRSTNRSVLMEMLGKVLLVMRRSVTFVTVGYR
ncbi:hypothetical protein SHIRM173S_10785 [Streptomyces hirsutus]